jgi:hypothetical protein
MLNDDEIKDFVEAQVPKNTKQKAKADPDVYKRWMKSALPRDQREIHNTASGCIIRENNVRSHVLNGCF